MASPRFMGAKYRTSKRYDGASFVGRRTELKVLDDEWRSGTDACVPIYGRRRVGKRELIIV